MNDKILNQYIADTIASLAFNPLEIKGIYELFYENIGDEKIKKLFACFHSRLNELFELMNSRNLAGTQYGNKHYFADQSRELITLIDKIDKINIYFFKRGKKVLINSQYEKHIIYVKKFLRTSSGSIIPEDYKNIDIINYESIFKISSRDLVILQNEEKITRDFARDQLKKCQIKINDGDYAGAITNARTLVEDVICKEIYMQITGEFLESKGDLVVDWKELSKKMNLDPDKIPDDFLKQTLRGLSSIIHGIASISNKMSERHTQNYKPEQHHAMLATNSALTLIEFLFGTLEFQNLVKKVDDK